MYMYFANNVYRLLHARHLSISIATAPVYNIMYATYNIIIVLTFDLCIIQSIIFREKRIIRVVSFSDCNYYHDFRNRTWLS